MTQFHKIAEPEKPQSTLIFVHGLDGYAFETWGGENAILALVKKRFPQINIYSVEYEANFTKKPNSSNMDLSERSYNLLNALVNKKLHEKPLTFICHSYGGLVVKQMLKHAFDELNGDEKFKHFLENTRRVMFLSTPHLGKSLGTLVSLFGVASEVIKDIVNIPALEKLNHDYVQIAGQYFVRHKVLIEMKPTYIKGVPYRVVDEVTGNPNLLNTKPVMMDEDHYSIAKPTEGSDLHDSFIGFLEMPMKFLSPDFKENYEALLAKFKGYEKLILNLVSDYDLSNLTPQDILEKAEKRLQELILENAHTQTKSNDSFEIDEIEAEFERALQNGDLAKIDKLYDELIALKGAKKFYQANARGYLGKAQGFKDKFQFEKAAENYEQATKVLSQYDKLQECAIMREAAQNFRLAMNFTKALRLAQEAQELATTLKTPLVLAKVHHLLGQIFEDKTDYAASENHYKAALDLFSACENLEDADVSPTLNNLASLYQATNRMEKAEPLMERALAIDEASFGAMHPRVGIRLNNLAQLYQATNRMEKAEPLMERALAIDEASIGAMHPSVAIDLNNLAQLYQATNRMELAEPLMERALAIDEASFGAMHPRVGIRLNNLAQLYQATNRMEKAEPLAKRTLEIFIAFSKKSGHQHPHLEAAFQNYLVILLQLGKSEAEIIATLDNLSS